LRQATTTSRIYRLRTTGIIVFFNHQFIMLLALMRQIPDSFYWFLPVASESPQNLDAFALAPIPY
jgi:hypothetical protein